MPSITALPLEILDYIAFELTTFEPLGPPSLVLPLLLTSRHLHAALSPGTNPALYARVFRHKFDAGAIERRAFTPTHTQCVEQLVRYCRAMQVLRAGDVYVDTVTAELVGFDRNAAEALLTAFVMMLEDDGKNARQLLEWAGADVFAERFVRRRLYEAREMNDGWPLENGPNACALWLMWMLTSEEKLRNETPAQREQMIKIILPFVFVSLRYPTSEAPPHFYTLPLPLPTLPTLPNTHNSPHGPYPTYPTPSRSTRQVHFDTRPVLSYPLAAPAAKLLYFARREQTPLSVPPHLALTRAHAHAAGNFDIGATVDDLSELNWSWTARLPLGAGLAHLPLGAGLTRLPLGGGLAQRHSEHIREPHGVPPPWVAPSLETETEPRPWAGKAPHARRMREKSRAWDADWWRLRLCGDPTRTHPRVRYGRVYEPGCMDGLWVGRMIITEATLSQFIMAHATHPPPGVLTDDAPLTQQAAVYMRLREAHAVAGDPLAGGLPTGTGAGAGPAFDEGMANAWFAGPAGDVRVFSGGGAAERASERGKDRVLVQAGGAGGVYRCWAGAGAGGEKGQGEAEWEGYVHDPLGCEGCRAREAIVERERERRQEREREALFRGVGLGLDEVPPESEDDDDDDDDEEVEVEVEDDVEGEDDDAEGGDAEEGEVGEEEEEEEEWDPVGETQEYVTVGPDGQERVHAAAPRAHCRRKVLPCDGVKEIVLFGETDERHGQAWNHYTFYGRVRPWDGLVGIVRKPRDHHNGYLFFYGYLVGGENFVGNWRITSADPTGPVWESSFAMSRREE